MVACPSGARDAVDVAPVVVSPVAAPPMVGRPAVAACGLVSPLLLVTLLTTEEKRRTRANHSLISDPYFPRTIRPFMTGKMPPADKPCPSISEAAYKNGKKYAS